MGLQQSSNSNNNSTLRARPRHRPPSRASGTDSTDSDSTNSTDSVHRHPRGEVGGVAQIRHRMCTHTQRTQTSSSPRHSRTARHRTPASARARALRHRNSHPRGAKHGLPGSHRLHRLRPAPLRTTHMHQSPFRKACNRKESSSMTKNMLPSPDVKLDTLLAASTRLPHTPAVLPSLWPTCSARSTEQHRTIRELSSQPVFRSSSW